MPENISDNLEEELRQVVADVTGVKIGDLKPGSDFWKDLNIDSIKAIEITVAIEKKYKIKIRDEQITTISTISQATGIVREALKKKQDEQK